MRFPVDKPIHIVMLGCGGTGGHIAPHLYRLLYSLFRPAKVILCDGDIVEKKNLVRQNFIAADLGKNKAEVLATRYAGAFGMETCFIDHFIESELPYLLTKDLVVLANIAGSTPDECAEVAAKLEDTDVHMIELNISCPNVKQGGAAFGTSCEMAAEVTRRVRAATTKPLVVKLSPNVTSIADIAKSVEAAGADAVSLINTLLGMRINIDTGRPILHNNVGGMSGPAVFPIAVRMVWQVANAVKIPVIGMGGVSSGRDAIELMMAGASAVQVGAAIFTDPYAPVRIVDEMNEFLDSKGIASVRDIIGTVKPW